MNTTPHVRAYLTFDSERPQAARWDAHLHLNQQVLAGDGSTLATAINALELVASPKSPEWFAAFKTLKLSLHQAGKMDEWL